MNRIKSILREPPIHFLLIGACLFLLFELTRDTDTNTVSRIVVSPGQIEQLAANFERTWIRPPTEAEVTGLINEFVRDEVYYREALALGLDKDDPLIRRRMRQKLEFVLEDLSAEEAPSDEVLLDFLQQHQDRFTIKARVAFEQLYLNPDNHQNLKADAENILASLRAEAAPEGLGDPIMIGQKFALATQSEISRQFGRAFALEVFALNSEDWSGPLYSGLGVHLVRVTARQEGRLLTLAEIRDRIEREWQAQRRKEFKDKAYQKLLEGYEVVIEPPQASNTPTGGMQTSQPGVPAQ
jgi:hypothetical protein